MRAHEADGEKEGLVLVRGDEAGGFGRGPAVGMGEIVAVDASGDVQGWTSLTLHHASGVTSQASICCKATGENRTEVEVFGATGSLRYDGRAGNPAETFANLRRTFVAVAGGTPHPADVTRGLHLQRLIANAEAQLAG